MDRIIVATDFSTRSEMAVERAILIAKRSGASLSLVHVVDSDQSKPMVDAEQAAAWFVLADTVQAVKEEGVTVDAQVRIDDVPAGILAAADDAAAELIIVGPPRRRLRDVFIGTTAERLLKTTQRPLLVALQTPSAPYSRTLLALDFDEASKSAARAAASMGIFENTNVVGLHVFRTPARGMMQRAMSTAEAISAYVENERQSATRRLRELVDELDLPRMQHRLVPDKGSVARSILTSAQAEHANLIVVGTNKRKGIARLLIGSVTKDVLRDASRDILIVPVDCEASA